MNAARTAMRYLGTYRSLRNQDDCGSSQVRIPRRLWLRAYGIDSDILQTPKGASELELERRSKELELAAAQLQFTLNCKLSTSITRNSSTSHLVVDDGGGKKNLLGRGGTIFFRCATRSGLDWRAE